MASLDNDYVQKVFLDALEIIPMSVEGTDIILSTELNMLRGMFTLYKTYTASGNSIPALGGVGLEGAVALAEGIISNGFDPRKRYINLRNLHKGFAI